MGYECAICSKNVEEDGRFCEIGISVDGLMKTINWRYQEDVSISLCPKHLAELKRIVYPVILVLMVFTLTGCLEAQSSSDTIQRQQQEKILQEGTAQIGMPAIKNFRERKILKDILELRDQEGLTTYTYVFSEQTGKLIFFGETIGYSIPYATQFTNPEKVAGYYSGNPIILPQADPNGLFSPASADGTWVLMKEPGGNTVKPVYIEPRIIVSPFKLPNAEYPNK